MHAASPSPAPPPSSTVVAPAREPLSSGERMLIGAASTFGIGVALQWGVAAGTGRLSPGDRHSDYSSVPPYVIGSIFAGSSLAMSATFAAIGGRDLGDAASEDLTRSRLLRGLGGSLTAVGLAGVFATTLAWPQISEECPIGQGCAIAGLHASAAALSLGAGTLAYGVAINPERSEPLPKAVAAPLVAGATLFTVGYLNALFFGMRFEGSGLDDDAGAKRVRDRMMIPFVGPWMVAAGPDVNWIAAAYSAGLGVMQIGGGVALVVAGIQAGRKSPRSLSRVRLLPSANGVTLMGRF